MTERPEHSSISPSKEVRTLLSNINFLLISLLTFGIFFMRQGALNEILPLLGANRLHLREGQIGLALTLIAIIQFITIFPSGRLADYFGRKAVITPGCFIAAISLAMMAESYSYWFLLMACAVMGIGIGMSGSTPSAYVADIIPRENYGAAMGTYRAISDMGFVIGPVLLGWLADANGLKYSLMVNSLFLFLIVLIFQGIAKEPRRKQKK